VIATEKMETEHVQFSQQVFSSRLRCVLNVQQSGPSFELCKTNQLSEYWKLGRD